MNISLSDAAQALLAGKNYAVLATVNVVVRMVVEKTTGHQRAASRLPPSGAAEHRRD